MESSEIAGWLALGSSLLLTCVGLPVQILRLHKVKSTEGLSGLMMGISFAAYTLWFTYGCLKQPLDYFLFAANLPGILFGGIILLQILRYRRTPSDE